MLPFEQPSGYQLVAPEFVYTSVLTRRGRRPESELGHQLRMSGLDCWKDLLVEDARKGLRRSRLVSRVEGGKRTAMISHRMSLKLPHDIVVSVIVLVLQNVN
jgi:hypothetical protein